MRILILTTLFLAPIYYFTHEEAPVTSEISIDSVKVKMGAPKRQEESAKTKIKPVAAEKSSASSENFVEQVGHTEDEDPNHFQEISNNDLEADWNSELKDMLGRLEPAESEEIHKSYIAQQESYQAELDALLNEKEQKTTDEEINEIEQSLAQLDQNHQNRLKEILGAHYEAVRDYYSDFVEASQSDY
jgi:hypothetical protein